MLEESIDKLIFAIDRLADIVEKSSKSTKAPAAAAEPAADAPKRGRSPGKKPEAEPEPTDDTPVDDDIPADDEPVVDVPKRGDAKVIEKQRAQLKTVFGELLEAKERAGAKALLKKFNVAALSAIPDAKLDAAIKAARVMIDE